MQTLLDPAVLFFALGVLAGAVRSNLEIPPAVSKFLSLYLLMALGLKGGFALAQAEYNPNMALAIVAALTMAFAVPAIGYTLLKNKVAKLDAAAIAASYGSVSAVTFVTALQTLDNWGTPAGGHMTVAMVLMETPAILMAVMLANTIRQSATASHSMALGQQGVLVQGGGPHKTSIGHLLKESLTDGAQILLLGSLVVGYISGESGQKLMQPFAGDLFKGLLAFFLLDMGLLVAKNFAKARKASPALLAYALGAPWVHATLALGLGVLMGLNAADTGLLMVLSASASYIVVPAVLRHAIPEANPSLYLGLSLGVTFPMNLLLGIPVYLGAAAWALG